MRIYHLTPGTANFHCGSCLRDLDLIKRLRSLGHEVMLVPLYLPLMHDDERSDVKEDTQVFLGGINLFLQQKSWLFRYLPKFISRWLDSDKLLHRAASRANMTSARLLGEMTLGSFAATDGKQKKEWRKLVDWLKTQPRPDVVSLSNGLLIGVAKSIREELGVPVVCTLQGEDSFLDGLGEYRERCWEAFREQSQYVSQFVAVSQYYRDRMRAALRLPDERIVSVWNGVDLDKFPHRTSEPVEQVIGYLARMCRDKGLETLVNAYIGLCKDRREKGVALPKLRIAGVRTPGDVKFVAEMEQRLELAKLSDHVEWLPNVSFEEKIEFLHSLSVLTVPALYGESFGLYVIEAMACGIPVIQPRHAGFTEILTESGSGVLFEVDELIAYEHQIEKMLSESQRRVEHGLSGRRAVERTFNSQRMAEEFAAVCEATLS